MRDIALWGQSKKDMVTPTGSPTKRKIPTDKVALTMTGTDGYNMAFVMHIHIWNTICIWALEWLRVMDRVPKSFLRVHCL